MIGIMRERVFAIILAVLVGLAAVGMSVQLASVLPVSLAACSAIAFYALGKQSAQRSAKKRQQSYSDRNYEKYLEWRAGRD
ncbi:hypothetical protein [Leucobacter sp.]